MLSLEQHFSYAEAALADAVAAPLSARKARLVAALIDALIDRCFDAGRTGAEDILAFRTKLLDSSPALASVVALAAARPDGPQLRLDVESLRPGVYAGLSEAQYMVSLYNGSTIPRLFVLFPDGTRQNAPDLLAGALDALRKR
ncbi:MAG: hypothetical protein ABIO40_12045 [Devosia sp.]